MKLGNMPHRFYQFKFPTHAPFDVPANCWPTIVGHFFAPVVRHRAVKAYVFLDHRPNDIEIRIASTRPKEVEHYMDQIAARWGIVRSSTGSLAETVGGHAYHGNRWTSPEKGANWALARRRSELMFRFMHAGCALFIDALVPNGNRFEIEENKDKENPNKNVFESAMHLIANFSKADFDVLIVGGQGAPAQMTTLWMSAPSVIAPTKYGPPGARCSL